MQKPPRHYYVFGPFRVDPSKRVLQRNGQAIPLAPKAFEMLVTLIENNTRMLQKDELLETLWPGCIVEEANLTQTIYLIRRALAAGAPDQPYIETVPKRGYRFVAPVEIVWDEVAEEIEPEPNPAVPSVEEPPPAEVKPDRPFTPLADPPAVAPAWLPAAKFALPARLLGLLGLLGLGLLSVFWLWRMPVTEPSAALSAQTMPVRSIAVLPFKPLDSAGNDNYLGLGMADVLSTRLSKFEQLIVQPTSSVRKYDGLDTNPLVAGAELHVESVLEGSFQKWKDRLRVTVRLVHMPDGRTSWTGKFDEKYTDIFEVQDSISDQVAEALALELTREKRAFLFKRYTENTAAYELYLKGRYWWNKRTADNLKKAITCFEQAINLAPNYALAYAGLADCYNLLSLYDVMAPSEAFPKARAAALKALEMDNSLAEAHTSLAWVFWVYDWDWPSAEREFKRALELGPGYSATYDWYGTCLAQRGQFDEALARLQRAQQLEPLSLVVLVHLGWDYYYAGRYEDAIAQYRKALDLDQHYAWAHFHLGQVYRQKRMYPQAIAELNQAIVLSSKSPRHRAELACIYAASGDHASAQQLLNQLLQQRKEQYVSPYSIAMIYATLQQPEQAFEWLDRASESRAARLVRLNVDPVFASLHNDPRFKNLVRRLGLEPAS
jgi:DNA-binding winged helix-turn-helix (wHTH) protein/TolB-like protein/Tfp pilus assembly protein PilF